MERRVLTARRRLGKPDSTSHHQPPKSPARNISAGRAEPAKNLANTRMKRLRESLAKELNDSTSGQYLPPAKRFAPSTQEQAFRTPQPADKSIPIKTPHSDDQLHNKSPRKRYSPYGTSSPKLSVNMRLREAQTSTPMRKLQSKPNSLLVDENTDIGKVDKSLGTGNSAGTSGIGLLYDDDVNITDVSGSNNNYSSNLYSSSISNASMICHANDAVTEENMDWSPSEADLISNIREVRDNVHDFHTQPPIAFSSVNSTVQMNPLDIYVVVDTNIFIDKLQTVANIMQMSYTDNSQPVIYVPWMVIQELDYFKDGYSVSERHPTSKVIQTRCRKAVKFINECLIARKSNFKGQPVQRAAESRLKGQTADDSILACCIQLFTEGYEVMLLSSDTNLRNKAMISNVKAFHPSDILKELKKKSQRKVVNFVEEMSKKLSLICSYMLHFELKAHFGEQGYEAKAFKALPWPFRECILNLHEYYDEVFRSHMPKQCRKVVDDLHELLVLNDVIANEVKFMELCLSLLIYFQNGLPKYDSNIQNTIDEVKQLENEFLR